MKKAIIFCCSLISSVFILLSLAPASDFPRLTGPYLGQKPPGTIPELFLSFIFSKNHPEWVFCTEFSPDGNEFYFTECDIVTGIARIMVMRYIADVWTKPEIASFSGEYNDNDVRLAPNGKTIFWRSWRPLPGKDKPEEHSFIWFARMTHNSWSEARPLKCGGDFLKGGYPTIVNNGTLYFSARFEDSVGETDIYYSTLTDGLYDSPKNLGPEINTKYSEGDVYVAPDESFLIVSCWRRPDNNGESDLYISFRDHNEKWSPLRNMGKIINTGNNENCPSISPDGEYFFFQSADLKSNPKKTNTYWISAEAIKQLQSSE